MTTTVPFADTELAALDPLLGREFESPWAERRRRFLRNKLAVASLAFLVVLTLAAVFAGPLTKWDPNTGDYLGIVDQKTGATDYGLSGSHWLGTDRIGRDLYSQLLFGARVSLTIAWLAAISSTVLAILIGAVAGWWRRADSPIMRFADIMSALPYIVFITFFAERFGRNMFAVILALLVPGWMGGARQFRAGVLQAKGQDYVEAARAAGCGSWRILGKHILPNAIQPMIIGISFSIGATVLTESVFGFLGLGVADKPSWGRMVAEGRNEIFENGHMFMVPAIALVLTVLAFTFIGEGVRDALDPKLKGN